MRHFLFSPVRFCLLNNFFLVYALRVARADDHQLATTRARAQNRHVKRRIKNAGKKQNARMPFLNDRRRRFRAPRASARSTRDNDCKNIRVYLPHRVASARPRCRQNF